jgi:DNA topoisomerase VI subunit B
MEFETEDWELFRTIEKLGVKAGVSPEKIAALVAKELMDNALDANLDANTDTLPWIGQISEDGFLIKDNGLGIDPDVVANMFFINRPLKSTKHLRLSTRGALGNGLRVVAGAVLATGGSLIVTTRGQIMKLTPQQYMLNLIGIRQNEIYISS